MKCGRILTRTRSPVQHNQPIRNDVSQDFRGAEAGVVARQKLYTLQVWDLQQGKCVRTLTGHSRPVQRLHIAGGRLYSIGGRSLRVWDLATYACVRVLQQPRESGALSALAVSPDGTVYVAGQVASRSVADCLDISDDLVVFPPLWVLWFTSKIGKVSCQERP